MPSLVTDPDTGEPIWDYDLATSSPAKKAAAKKTSSPAKKAAAKKDGE